MPRERSTAPGSPQRTSQLASSSSTATAARTGHGPGNNRHKKPYTGVLLRSALGSGGQDVGHGASGGLGDGLREL